MPHYIDQEGFPIYTDAGTPYLELHDNRTMWKLQREELFGEEFYEAVSRAIQEFELITGVELYCLGRSGRHICVEDTEENRENYEYLKSEALRLEAIMIDQWNYVKGFGGFEWPLA